MNSNKSNFAGNKVQRKPYADPFVDETELKNSIELLRKIKCAVFIVTYNAEGHIPYVLDRIPIGIRDKFAQIFIIDDSSSDSTFDAAYESGKKLGYENLKILRTPFNRGYGGNQKLGYLYSIKQNFDVVILLHGDGQYAPECLPRIVNSFQDDSVDAVFGSRMLRKGDALKGGMPFYKWVGNRMLTAFENLILKTSLSEFHSGYRAYRTNALKEVPFVHNSDDFHFDTEIIIQLLALKKKVLEVPIPTFYGKEKCNVKGLRYAKNCVKSVIKYRLVQVGLFYEPNFDFRLFEGDNYYFKSSPRSLHQHMIKRVWDHDSEICELGANRGELSARLAEKVRKVTAVDKIFPHKAGKAEPLQFNLDEDFVKILGKEKYDAVIALDLIEHLDDPAESLGKIFRMIKPGGRLFASTANVGYIITRMSLFVGHFNYGKRGILDLTHKRLFTIYSFQKLLVQNGFLIKEAKFFGPPIVDLISKNTFCRCSEAISHFLAGILPSLFAYNFLIVAQRTDDIGDIYDKTFRKESC